MRVKKRRRVMDGGEKEREGTKTGKVEWKRK